MSDEIERAIEAHEKKRAKKIGIGCLFIVLLFGGVIGFLYALGCMMTTTGQCP